MRNQNILNIVIDKLIKLEDKVDGNQEVIDDIQEVKELILDLLETN